MERQEVLYKQTSARLKELGYSGIHTFYGDGNEGLPKYAPFAKILITAESPEIPSQLVKQLRIGGLLVVPIQGRMKRLLKLSEEQVNIEDFGAFMFVPMLPGTVNQQHQNGAAGN
jgi:protein-L-isoaspartate(D-aspartate) O-methyltransferase